MAFRKPCHMPFRKLIPPFSFTVLNEDVRALKNALKNLNTRKSSSRRVLLTGILSKNAENYQTFLETWHNQHS